VVFVMTNRFRPQDAQYSREQTVNLPVATADTGKLIAAATVQGGLLDRPDDVRAQARMHAMDALNAAMAVIP
jgi:hypothetical protein